MIKKVELELPVFPKKVRIGSFSDQKLISKCFDLLNYLNFTMSKYDNVISTW